MQNRRRLIFPRAASAKQPDPELSFEFECPRTWDSLTPTKDPKVRDCDDCQKPVHLSRDAKEAHANAALGRCVHVPAVVEGSPAAARSLLSRLGSVMGSLFTVIRRSTPPTPLPPSLSEKPRVAPPPTYTSHGGKMGMFVMPEPEPTPLICWLVPLNGAQEERSIRLQRLTVIGSGVDADVVIDLVGVEKAHCQIAMSREGVFLRAIGESSNALVNGCPLLDTSELLDGYLVSIAGFRFVFKCSVPPDEYRAAFLRQL